MDEKFQRRLNDARDALVFDAVADVEGLIWTLTDEAAEKVLRTEARDPAYQHQTNVVEIIGPLVLRRALLDREGTPPFDGISAERVVELLNQPGAFGLRPMLPSPDDEDNPAFVPRFQLFVSFEDEFASLAEPTWNEVGRWHTFDLKGED